MLNVTRCPGKGSSGCSGCSGNRREISAGNAERQSKARPANWFLRGDSLHVPDGRAELVSPKQSVKVWPSASYTALLPRWYLSNFPGSWPPAFYLTSAALRCCPIFHIRFYPLAPLPKTKILYQ